MSSCGYCGRDNETHEVHCSECGSALPGVETNLSSASGPSTPPVPALLTTSLGRAISSVLGSILIATGVGGAVMRLFFDLSELANGEPLGKPGVYGFGVVAAI